MKLEKKALNETLAVTDKKKRRTAPICHSSGNVAVWLTVPKLTKMKSLFWLKQPFQLLIYLYSFILTFSQLIQVFKFSLASLRIYFCFPAYFLNDWWILKVFFINSIRLDWHRHANKESQRLIWINVSCSVWLCCYITWKEQSFLWRSGKPVVASI